MATYRDPVTGRFAKAPTTSYSGGVFRDKVSGRFARSPRIITSHTATFIPNRPVIYGVLPETPLVQAQLRYLTEEAADAARSIAPYRTGEYHDSIHVEESEGQSDVPGTVVLVADAPHAVYVEFGTSDTPTFAPLRRGMEAAGFDMDQIAEF